MLRLAVRVCVCASDWRRQQDTHRTRRPRAIDASSDAKISRETSELSLQPARLAHNQPSTCWLAWRAAHLSLAAPALTSRDSSSSDSKAYGSGGGGGGDGSRAGRNLSWLSELASSLLVSPVPGSPYCSSPQRHTSNSPPPPPPQSPIWRRVRCRRRRLCGLDKQTTAHLRALLLSRAPTNRWALARADQVAQIVNEL